MYSVLHGVLGVSFVCLFLNPAILEFSINTVLTGMPDIPRSKEVLLIYGTSDKVGNSYTPYCHEQVNDL